MTKQLYSDLFDFKTESRTTNTKTFTFVDVVNPVNLQKLLTKIRQSINQSLISNVRPRVALTMYIQASHYSDTDSRKTVYKIKIIK